MRFAVALVTLLIAGVLAAAGIAQRTILKPADHVDVVASAPAGVRYVVVPGSVLTAHDGGQRLHLEGAATAFAAYGRPADITAWLSGQRYAELRVDAEGGAIAPVVRTAPTVAGVDGDADPDPDGSDLWLDQARGQGALDWRVNLPSSTAMIIAADGAGAAPSTIRLRWTERTATPFAVPLIVAGAVLAVVGLLLYVWALVHVRRTRGPRRRPPARAPKRPQPPRYRPHRPAAVPVRGRRSVHRRTALPVAAALALLLGTVVVTGPAVPATAAPAAAKPAAAVGEEQARRIVEKVRAVAEEADAQRDAEVAAARFAGPALELRTAAYRIRAKDRKAKLPQAVPGPDATLRLILPQATDSWPRTLFVVVADRRDTKVAPLALAMVQDDPRADYKVDYAMSLMPGRQLPVLPSALLGAARLDAEANVLRVPPVQLAEDYGALLRDRDDEAAAVFDITDDELEQGVGEAVKKKAAKRLGSTAAITFKDLPVDASAVIAMSTAASGALVAVNLDEQWTVKPKRVGVTVKPSGGTKVLSRTSSTAEGIASVYGYQLLFFVPSAGSTKPVVLLGYAQGLVSAKEL